MLSVYYAERESTSKGRKGPVHTRLFMLFARKSPTAVIFVLLNHKPEVATPHKEHKPHRLLVMNPKAHREDDPIFSQRLERDGWQLKDACQIENRGYPKLFQTIQAEGREKTNPNRTHVIQLTRSIECLDYSEDFALRSVKQFLVANIARGISKAGGFS